MKNIIITMMLLSFTSVVSANNFYETGKVSRIVTSGTDFISVWIDGVNNTSQCSGGERWTINVNGDSLYKEKYSLLVAAATAGTPVRLFHLGSRGCGNWNSHQIHHVDVRYDGSLG